MLFHWAWVSIIEIIFQNNYFSWIWRKGDKIHYSQQIAMKHNDACLLSAYIVGTTLINFHILANLILPIN